MDEPPKKKRLRKKPFLIALGIVLLFFLAFQFPWGPSVDSVLLNSIESDSDEVPRTNNGLVDFAEIISSRISKGVTSENDDIVVTVSLSAPKPAARAQQD